MQKVRVFFRKKERARYFSHLDLNRAVARMLMRSGLPVAFTEGFNPHAKVVFAVPLSIYQSSVYEVFDFSLTRDVPEDEVLSALNGATVPDLPVIKVAEPVLPLSECEWAEYTVALTTTANAGEINALLSGEIVVRKKSKKGDIDTDIKPMIREITASDTDNGVELHCVVAAASNRCLNVSYIVDYISNQYEVFESSITRLALFAADGTLFA